MIDRQLGPRYNLFTLEREWRNGSAFASQAKGCGFESRLPLQTLRCREDTFERVLPFGLTPYPGDTNRSVTKIKRNRVTAPLYLSSLLAFCSMFLLPHELLFPLTQDFPGRPYVRHHSALLR